MLILIGIAVMAVLLRIGGIAYTHATHAPAEENRIIARNLAAGRGFTFTEFTVTGPTAIRGPVYPMLLAVVGPNRMKLILAINVAIGAATVFAAYALTKRLLSPLPDFRARGTDVSVTEAPAKSSFAPLLAALLFAIWPTQVYAATLTQGLSLAVLLTLASLALAFRRTPGSLIAAGLLAGLAALTEPVLALPLLLCAIVLGWRDCQRFWHWQDAAVFVFTAMLLIAPWLYRNAIVFGRPMPITSNFWRDAFLGQQPLPDQAAPQSPKAKRAPLKKSLAPREYDQLKVSESKRSAVFRTWTIERLQQEPDGYIKSCIARVIRIVYGDYGPHRTILTLFIVPAVIVWAVAVLLRRQNSRFRSVIIAIAIGLVLPMILVRAEPRMLALLDVTLILGICLLAWPKPTVERHAACR